MVSQYDTIIYGGWIFGNNINGLMDINKMAPKNLVLFAVGETEPGAEAVKTVKETNKIGETPLFYMWGGLRLEKLGFLNRRIKMVKKSNINVDFKLQNTYHLQ